jgi:hypothetical protein
MDTFYIGLIIFCILVLIFYLSYKPEIKISNIKSIDEVSNTHNIKTNDMSIPVNRNKIRDI